MPREQQDSIDQTVIKFNNELSPSRTYPFTSEDNLHIQKSHKIAYQFPLVTGLKLSNANPGSDEVYDLHSYNSTSWTCQFSKTYLVLNLGLSRLSGGSVCQRQRQLLIASFNQFEYEEAYIDVVSIFGLNQLIFDASVSFDISCAAIRDMLSVRFHVQFSQAATIVRACAFPPHLHWAILNSLYQLSRPIP